mgnify:CR=1 FL=1
MAHHLNTNKQFMIGNGILAFAVIFVVVIFVYMSMRLQQRKEGERYFAETYNITLVKGFTGDSISVLLNDSVLIDQRINKEPFTFEVKRFAEQSALMIVDQATDKLSLFELSEKGGNYRFEKEDDEVKKFGWRFLGFVASLALMPALLLTCVQWRVSSMDYFREEYAKYDVLERVDMNMDDLLYLTEEMMAYLYDKREELQVTVPIRGAVHSQSSVRAIKQENRTG